MSEDRTVWLLWESGHYEGGSFVPQSLVDVFATYNAALCQQPNEDEYHIEERAVKE